MKPIEIVKVLMSRNGPILGMTAKEADKLKVRLRYETVDKLGACGEALDYWWREHGTKKVLPVTEFRYKEFSDFLIHVWIDDLLDRFPGELHQLWKRKATCNMRWSFQTYTATRCGQFQKQNLRWLKVVLWYRWILEGMPR